MPRSQRGKYATKRLFHCGAQASVLLERALGQRGAALRAPEATAYNHLEAREAPDVHDFTRIGLWRRISTFWAMER